MRILCVFLLPLLFAGCSRDIDPEDRHFFNKGWLWPHKDIDLDPAFDPPHPEHPEETPMPKTRVPDRYREDPFVN